MAGAVLYRVVKRLRKPVQGAKGLRKPVQGVKGLRKPVQGVKGLRKPMQGVKGLRKPVQCVKRLRKPVQSVKGLRKGGGGACSEGPTQGVTKRCRLSWLTNTPIGPEYTRSNAGKRWSCGVSANEYSCTHGAQINFRDLTPYLTYKLWRSNSIFNLWSYLSESLHTYIPYMDAGWFVSRAPSRGVVDTSVERLWAAIWHSHSCR